MRRWELQVWAFVVFLAGCATSNEASIEPSERSRLTIGQVQMALKSNETNQAEVLEAFGAPNLVTVNSEGEEVWTYQHNATLANSSSSNILGTIIVLGGTKNISGFEQSSRTMTLIIKFRMIEGVKRVSSFYSRTSSF